MKIKNIKGYDTKYNVIICFNITKSKYITVYLHKNEVTENILKDIENRNITDINANICYESGDFVADIKGGSLYFQENTIDFIRFNL